MLTQQQLELHNKFITGSKVASILGIPGAFKSKYQLFCEMHGDVAIENKPTMRMKMGNYMEDGISNYCENELGWKFKKIPSSFLYHPKYNFIGGIIDRLRADNTIVEFKMVDSRFKKSWMDEDGNLKVPDYYLTQVYLYMAILDMPGVLVAVFGGNDPATINIPRNSTVENFIIKKCVEFWDDLENDHYPDIDSSQTCTETLKKLYPDDNDTLLKGENLHGHEKLLKQARWYKEASKEEKECKDRKNLHGNYIRNALNKNLGVVWGDNSKITYKKCKDGIKFNENRFKDENPELYGKYIEPKKGHRTLRINLKEEKNT